MEKDEQRILFLKIERTREQHFKLASNIDFIVSIRYTF